MKWKTRASTIWVKKITNANGNILIFDYFADEKLNRFKEVEELYDEIMKTIVGDHLENEDGKYASKKRKNVAYFLTYHIPLLFEILSSR
jgi:hypothetical protein